MDDGCILPLPHWCACGSEQSLCHYHGSISYVASYSYTAMEHGAPAVFTFIKVNENFQTFSLNDQTGEKCLLVCPAQVVTMRTIA